MALADPSWVAALAGLAGALTTLGRPSDAAQVLTAVPSLHPLRAQALTLACRAMADGALRRWRWPRPPPSGCAPTSRGRATRPRPSWPPRCTWRRWPPCPGASRSADIGDVPAQRAALARGAEEALLDMAAATADSHRRHALLDAAARTRPWSVW